MAPNGGQEKHTGRSTGRRSSDYNPDWCNERHDKIERQLAEIWGADHGGIKAVWEKMGGFDRKLWAIILGQIAIMGGMIVAFAKLFISGGCG